MTGWAALCAAGRETGEEHAMSAKGGAFGVRAGYGRTMGGKIMHEANTGPSVRSGSFCRP